MSRSVVVRGLTSGDLAVQPRPRVSPVALGRSERNPEGLGGLNHGQSGEEAELYQLCREGIDPVQPLEGFVQGHEVLALDAGNHVDLGQLHAVGSAAVTDAPLAPRLLDEDAAHRLRGGGEEVAPAVPSRIFGPYKSKIGFVHQRRGLERLAGCFTGKLLRGQTAQFGVDQREQLLCGPRIALLDGREDSGNVIHRRAVPRAVPSDDLEQPLSCVALK
jgi:hypothetical protein